MLIGQVGSWREDEKAAEAQPRRRETTNLGKVRV